MIKKSYIKDKSYYKDAENMQKGWGHTLRFIDTLKDKIQYKKAISLNDFCYSLYGDGYCSHCWQAFRLYCNTPLRYNRKKLIYDGWKGIFDVWVKTEYDAGPSFNKI